MHAITIKVTVPYAAAVARGDARCGDAEHPAEGVLPRLSEGERRWLAEHPAVRFVVAAATDEAVAAAIRAAAEAEAEAKLERAREHARLLREATDAVRNGDLDVATASTSRELGGVPIGAILEGISAAERIHGYTARRLRGLDEPVVDEALNRRAEGQRLCVFAALAALGRPEDVRVLGRGQGVAPMTGIVVDDEVAGHPEVADAIHAATERIRAALDALPVHVLGGGGAPPPAPYIEAGPGRVLCCGCGERLLVPDTLSLPAAAAAEHAAVRDALGEGYRSQWDEDEALVERAIVERAIVAAARVAGLGRLRLEGLRAASCEEYAGPMTPVQYRALVAARAALAASGAAVDRATVARAYGWRDADEDEDGDADGEVRVDGPLVYRVALRLGRRTATGYLAL